MNQQAVAVAMVMTNKAHMEANAPKVEERLQGNLLYKPVTFSMTDLALPLVEITQFDIELDGMTCTEIAPDAIHASVNFLVSGSCQQDGTSVGFANQNVLFDFDYIVEGEGFRIESLVVNSGDGVVI